MFGTLGGPEVLLLLVLALIVFGPRKLPEIGKSMGRMLAEFRKASNDFKRTLEDEVEAERMRTAIAEEPVAPAPPAAEPPVPAEAAEPPAASEETAEATAPPPAESALATPSTAPPELRPPDESVSRG